jgi:hypothetical protein
VENYYRESAILPDWTDREKIKMGQDLFEDNGLMAFTLLGCYSLPVLYTCGKGGTYVLGATQQLEAHVDRRIYETSQMVLDLMTPGGLTEPKDLSDNPDVGRGIRACQKVRLMHAAVRFLILHQAQSGKEPPSKVEHLGHAMETCAWKEEWGVPIGQEYMGGTLQTFSYTILDGLRQLDVKVSKEMEEAYIHTWNVVGYVMGVDPEFLSPVQTFDQSKALLDAVLDRIRSTSEEEQHHGVVLTGALLSYMGKQIKSQSKLASIFPVAHAPKVVMCNLISERDMEILGLQYDFVDKLMAVPFWVGAQAMAVMSSDFSSAFHALSHWVFKHMANALIGRIKVGNRKPFLIPDHLAGSWGIEGDDVAAHDQELATAQS